MHNMSGYVIEKGKRHFSFNLDFKVPAVVTRSVKGFKLSFMLC